MSAPDADVLATDVLEKALDTWRAKQGRELTDRERDAIAVLTVEAAANQGEAVQKAAVADAAQPTGRTGFFRKADERRLRATLDAPPRSPQAERIRETADRQTDEAHRARD